MKAEPKEEGEKPKWELAKKRGDKIEKFAAFDTVNIPVLINILHVGSVRHCPHLSSHLQHRPWSLYIQLCSV